ncbi:SDR family NAD(P)-dependent oxidoreductase [Actinoplanes sp. RD1]|uniref:SDR family NAD(P)-dependent oxidoreductase n=1 Tax=Actinoplanes sp. RD1 TaxID=3064538 RepID=UPI0027422B91|nr:3-oxoacyl-ACP reductase family protein [Actinoplanes sp. RD1]
MTLSSRAAVVTGGSRGIGAAICRQLAADGFAVHLVYRDADEAAKAVAGEIEADGGTVTTHKADVADEAQVTELVDAVTRTGAGVDVLVNNAAIIDDKLLATTRLTQWEHVLRVNLTGPWLMSRAVLPVMLEQGRGRIINISSNSARIPGPGQTAYAASKGGLEALSRGLAVEVGRKGIRVNVVAPGRVRTDMTGPVAGQLGDESQSRWGVPEDISALVGFLASEQADYIQGQVITADGGRLVHRPRAGRGGKS